MRAYWMLLSPSALHGRETPTAAAAEMLSVLGTECSIPSERFTKVFSKNRNGLGAKSDIFLKSKLICMGYDKALVTLGNIF